MSRAAALADALEDVTSLAIVCHDNPGPDCLASALALEAIATALGIDETAIVHGGEISHQQSRAFVNLLEIEAVGAEEVDVDEYEAAFVDHSKAGVTSVLPASVDPTVVVDHHPGETTAAAFADVRTEYGATSTIFVEYLLDLEIDVATRLASALPFALHRERLDFVRDPTEREYRTDLAVYPHAELDLLDQLYGTAFTPSTLDAIGRAITTRERRGSSLVSTVGRTVETDALPQAADYLLTLEGVDTVLVYGVVDGTIRLSARSILESTPTTFSRARTATWATWAATTTWLAVASRSGCSPTRPTTRTRCCRSSASASSAGSSTCSTSIPTARRRSRYRRLEWVGPHRRENAGRLTHPR